MASVEEAKKMLQAIEQKRRDGEIDTRSYQILREKWAGILEGLGAEVEADEVGEETIEEDEAIEGKRLPSHAAAEDIGSFVAKLVKNIQNLKDEIMVLEIEVESAQNTLKGLQSKLSSGAIDKAKFTKMSQQYTSKIKSIAAQISEKQEEKEGVFRRLGGLRKRIEGEIEEHKETLQKIDKLIRIGGPK
jgi:chromosome segregation ATPase